MFVEGVDVNSVSEVYQEPSSVQKFLNGSSTDKHDYQDQVDTNSSDLSNCQRKKKKRARKKRESSGCLGSNDEGALSLVMGAGEISQEASGGPNSELFSGKKKKKSKSKKKRELTACLMTSLGSTVEGASPSVLVVPHSSVGEISLEQSDEILASFDVVKPMEEVVAGNSTSVLTGVEISQEKCPNGESEFGKMKEKSKMGNLEDSKAGSGRIHQKRKKKSSASHISSLESIEEGVQESSAPYICRNQLNEAPESSYSHKNMDVMVAGLVVSQRKASSGCSNGEPACQNDRKKSMMKKLENSNMGNSIVMKASLVDIPETDFEQDISVRDISTNHVVKAEDDSSILAAGETSQEKASGGPHSELLSGQKKKESKRKKRQKFSACPVTILGSIEEGAPPSVLVVPDSSGGEISLKQSDEMRPCDLVKLREEVVAGNDTSLLDGRKISQEIASSDCPNGKSEFGKMEESKMGNLEENNAGHSRIPRRFKRNLVACRISNLESIEESVRESLAGDKCLNHMEEAPEPGYKGKMMEEVATGIGISQRRVSGECPVGEPASGKKRKKFMLGIFEESDKGNSAVMDVFMVDTPKTDFEQFNKDKLDVQNTVLSKEDRASDAALGGVPSIDNIVVDKLNIQTVLKDKIPSSSKLRAMIDGISLESHQQSQGGAHLRNSRKKLLILDLNGLLVDIVPAGPGGYNKHRILSQKAVFKRPFCDDFLQFCFDRFHVGIWSSRARKNVKSVVDYLMGKSRSNLLLCWDQSHCTKTGYKTVENREKPLLLKELKKIWEKHEPDLPWATGEYNESNTLLLDDSPCKALRNPPYTAIFPHSYSYKDKRDNSLGPGGDLRVYLEGLALADHVQKFVEQNPFGQRPITDTNLSWGFYRKIIGISSSKKRKNATNDPSACQGKEDDTNDPSACQGKEEDDTTDSLACQQQEEDTTYYSSPCR